jgi:phospholipid/cholesterol/gamma-HCH transport system substrate-binding protein
LKSFAFVAVTVLATGVLLATISQSGGGDRTVRAEFTDVTRLQTGDDVRMAGVRIGTVTGISIVHRTGAEVTMSLSTDVPLASTVTASIRYRNLVGQRYVALDQGDGSPDQQWPDDKLIGTDRTSPALDLTTLFDGFQPLFKALDPGQVNDLSYQIIQIFQGEGGTVDSLLTSTASLTSTLADKDAVIGQVVDNLNAVLDVVNARTGQVRTTISTLQQLVSGLAADRATLGSAVQGIAGLTQSVSGLLEDGRPALQRSIDSLGALSANLAANSSTLQTFLTTLPTKLDTIGRTVSYGSWVNFYVCSLKSSTGTFPTVPGYYGDTGVSNPAARCSG